MLLLRLSGGGRGLFVHVIPTWSGEGSQMVKCPSTSPVIDLPDTQQQQQNEIRTNITIPTNTQRTNGHSIRWVKLTSIIWEWNQSSIIPAHQLFYYLSSSRLICSKYLYKDSVFMAVINVLTSMLILFNTFICFFYKIKVLSLTLFLWIYFYKSILMQLWNANISFIWKNQYLSVQWFWNKRANKKKLFIDRFLLR